MAIPEINYKRFENRFIIEIDGEKVEPIKLDIDKLEEKHWYLLDNGDGGWYIGNGTFLRPGVYTKNEIEEARKKTLSYQFELLGIAIDKCKKEFINEMKRSWLCIKKVMFWR